MALIGACLCIVDKSPQTNHDTSPKSEPTLELHSRAALSVEAHPRSVCPDAGRNYGGRQKKSLLTILGGFQKEKFLKQSSKQQHKWLRAVFQKLLVIGCTH